MNTNYNYLFKILKKLKIKRKYHMKLLNDFASSFIFYENFFNKNNLFTGGGEEIEIKKEVFTYKDYKFIVRVLKDNENHNIIIKISSKMYGLCVLMFIDKDVDYVQLQNISNFPDCSVNKTLPYKGGGKILLGVVLNYLHKNYNIYKRNRIVLADNSNILCRYNNKTKNIFLAPMTTLKTGHTWYGTFGFRPYDDVEQKPDNRELRYYKQNYEKMQALKLIDNQFIIKLILDTDKKYGYNIINNDIIQKIINKNKNILIKDFLIKLLKINNFCIIFEKIYIDIILELKLYNFTEKLFYLDFKI
jgi:hypothetical protein